MAIIRFRPRPRQDSDGTTNLFFLLAPEEQRARIRQLARARMTVPQIASICRMSAAEVAAIVSAASE